MIPDVYAAIDCNNFLNCLADINVPNLNFTSGGLVGRVLTAFFPIILTLAGFLAVIIIIISGIEFITSSGNPEAAGKARSRLTYAIIGFIVILLSFAALQIVDYLFLKSGVV